MGQGGGTAPFPSGVCADPLLASSLTDDAFPQAFKKHLHANDRQAQSLARVASAEHTTQRVNAEPPSLRDGRVDVSNARRPTASTQPSSPRSYAPR